jgi:predicted GNAT family acetyltransferase
MAEVQEVRDNPDARRFEIHIGDAVAIAEYRLVQGGIMFTHTEVPEALGGRGLGSTLIRAGLKSARERGLKVLPVCPFFAEYFRKHAEERDILHPDYFKVLGIEA